MKKKNEPKRGTCSNCKRPDVRLVPRMKDPTCWSCQKYAQGTTGDERAKRLAEASTKFGDSRAAAKPPAPAAPKTEPVAEAIINKVRGHITSMKEKTEQEQTKKAWPSVVIYFDEVDADLYNHLIEMAKREYRNPDQQILYMLDCHLHADREQAS